MTINLETDAEPRNETTRSRSPHGGAPSGSRNGRYVDGNFTKEAIAERRFLRRVITGSGLGNMTSESEVNHEHPNRVSVEVERGEGRYAIRAPAHQDKEDWLRRLQRALGSRSKAFVTASLDRLLTACHLPRQLIPTTSVSAALALIESLEPKNEIEAAMAVDIACLYAACGNLLGRLADACLERPTMAAANAIAKLERALHSAIKTYYRIKHGNMQVIRIERLEVQAGAQALVGQVNRP